MAKFNIETPDDPNVKYFSYTASYKPGWFDIMRKPWQVIHDIDGANDGLVSLSSQRWGVVKGNLEDVNHRALAKRRTRDADILSGSHRLASAVRFSSSPLSPGFVLLLGA